MDSNKILENINGNNRNKILALKEQKANVVLNYHFAVSFGSADPQKVKALITFKIQKKQFITSNYDIILRRQMTLERHIQT